MVMVAVVKEMVKEMGREEAGSAPEGVLCRRSAVVLGERAAARARCSRVFSCPCLSVEEECAFVCLV
jgi:hypothetical protein